MSRGDFWLAVAKDPRQQFPKGLTYGTVGKYRDITLKSAGRLKCAGPFWPQSGRVKWVADLSVRIFFRLRRAICIWYFVFFARNEAS